MCTHLDLSLLGALLWKRKIDYDLLMASLSNIKGCRESNKGDQWEWLPLHRGFQGHSALASVAAVQHTCVHMPCARTNLPIAQDTGKWVENLPWTPLRSEKRGHSQNSAHAVETAQTLPCSILWEP